MEIWKPVLSLRGLYEVSNLGNARGAAKIDRAGVFRKERPLKQFHNEDGYLRMTTFVDGKFRCYSSHRLIYEAFVGPIPDGLTVNHKNGVRDDNRPENLEVLSHHENILHSKNVLKTDYTTFGNLRMTDEQRKKIHDLRAQGLRHVDIAQAVGFSESHIGNILAGRCLGRGPSAATP